MTTGTPRGATERAVTVWSSSRVAIRDLGPLAWVVLEELALRAERHADGFAVDPSVREVAGNLGVGKDAIAKTLGRLVDLGMIQCQTRRRAGRHAGSTYVLDADACLGAGLGLATVRVVAQPCPVTPCPVEPHAVQPDAANRATVGPPGPNPQPASPAPAGGRDPLTQSLFELPAAPATVPAPAPLTPTPTTASTTLSSSTPTPALPPSPPFPLPRSNRPDALAPGVRRDPGTVAGNPAGERSGLKGNLDREGETLC
jgi:hypothetical protein